MWFFRLFFVFTLFSLTISAQSDLYMNDSIAVRSGNDGQIESIVDRINRTESGKGTVRIIQDDSVSDRIGRPGKVDTRTNASVSRYIELSGWRIQVFSGNDPRVSKNEAFRKEADIKSVYPELGTYVTYTAPFWRLRIGDFQTFQDARNMMLSLKSTFPYFGREMSIIKEKIQIKQE